MLGRDFTIFSFQLSPVVFFLFTEKMKSTTKCGPFPELKVLRGLHLASSTSPCFADIHHRLWRLSFAMLQRLGNSVTDHKILQGAFAGEYFKGSTSSSLTAWMHALPSMAMTQALITSKESERRFESCSGSLWFSERFS